MSRWITVPLVHVVPEDDLVSHELTKQCVCSPLVEDEDAHGACVITHHSLDGRELTE